MQPSSNKCKNQHQATNFQVDTASRNNICIKLETSETMRYFGTIWIINKEYMINLRAFNVATEQQK
jgi:hypothetical protein